MFNLKTSDMPSAKNSVFAPSVINNAIAMPSVYDITTIDIPGFISEDKKNELTQRLWDHMKEILDDNGELPEQPLSPIDILLVTTRYYFGRDANAIIETLCTGNTVADWEEFARVNLANAELGEYSEGLININYKEDIDLSMLNFSGDHDLLVKAFKDASLLEYLLEPKQ